jgi:hypothetical protein
MPGLGSKIDAIEYKTLHHEKALCETHHACHFGAAF